MIVQRLHESNIARAGQLVGSTPDYWSSSGLTNRTISFGLVTGLGTFAQEYRIQLKANAQPFALCTPRNIPLALRPKVPLELGQMEGLGVISRVNEPIPWCAAMVVVPKPSGAVRICVDMKPLNENVL